MRRVVLWVVATASCCSQRAVQAETPLYKLEYVWNKKHKLYRILNSNVDPKSVVDPSLLHVTNPGIFVRIAMIDRTTFKMASRKLVGYDSAEDSDSTENISHIRGQPEV